VALGCLCFVGRVALEGLTAVSAFDDVVGVALVDVFGLLRLKAIGQLDESI